jgi:D-alanyl-lipoteichoic acid acyltransferase DltB (MBOAT superfamily)
MHGLPRVLLWSMLIVATPFIWFLPYAIMDQRTAAPNPALLQMGALRPFWSPAYLPFGKGAAFLKKALPKTADDLAVTQLKGIKLLLWANALIAIQAALGWIFISQLNVPTVAESIDAYLQSRAYPLGISWTALAFSTAKFALQVAIWVHLFIGVARLAGYRLPRGSWRPLESRTLMDYFNRFHYYFKELLADFFFAPTFFTTFKKHPRLRMFFATFMAAAVGNALWHFLRDIDLIARIGPAAAFETYTSYLFYCVVLATGVGLSQIRVNSGIRPSNTVAGKLWSFTFVWSFVVCMHLFSDGSRQHSLDERLSFLASLFGVI